MQIYGSLCVRMRDQKKKLLQQQSRSPGLGCAPRVHDSVHEHFVSIWSCAVHSQRGVAVYYRQGLSSGICTACIDATI